VPAFLQQRIGSNNNFGETAMKIGYAGAAIVCTFILSNIASAAGRNIYVTNDGTDSAGCGAQANACRSISQGLENAGDGDTILVGAGRYGNISGSASYSGAGDEHPQPLANFTGVTGCIICIQKAVSIYSLHGPSVTIIEGAPLTSQEATVFINHEGVNFGAAGRGFTLTGGSGYGVVFDQDDATGTLGIHLKKNVSIAGNVDLADATGFAYLGREYYDSVCPVDDCIPTAVITIAQNESIDNPTAAFNLTTNDLYLSVNVVAQNNYARGAGIGFNVPGGARLPFGTQSSANISLTGNVAEHNKLGFFALVPGKMLNNTAANNSQAGFWVVAGGAFQGNTAVGNAGPGAIVQFFLDLFNPDGPASVGFTSFTQNNFYGNDRNRPALTISSAQNSDVPVNAGPSAHCGVLNAGQLTQFAIDLPNPPVVSPLNANGNFWGATHGPAPTGASDAVGGACDKNGGKTTATSYASTGFAITTH
jgi:hypothetical protein